MRLLFVLSKSGVSEFLDCEVVCRRGRSGEGITGRETAFSTIRLLALLCPGGEAREDARPSRVILLGEVIKGVSGDDISGCALGFAVCLGVDVSS